MMIRQIAVGVALSCLLGSCFPVPSYSVDPYAGSLKQCLDIQGTYESTSFYNPEGKYSRNSALTGGAQPVSLWRKTQKGGFKQLDFAYSKTRPPYFKIWMRFKFLDDQRVEIGVFNELGQEVSVIYNMKAPDRGALTKSEDEEFTCNASSWQKSYTMTSGGEGGMQKETSFDKLTKLTGGMLKKESKTNFWRGQLGLYGPDKNFPSGGGVTYHRKVDLTVEDIRENNDKAKKAIAQYDEFVARPPE
ncbi:MAG: hypothetical protein LBI16_05170 [Burkholderiales bacterium]|nr:hypothetical protein [Burkholderiales bacterium]